MRMRVRRKKRLSLHGGPVARPTVANTQWRMDSDHDQLVDGRRFRVLTVSDQWSRESVLGEADSLSRPLPKAIAVDLGTDFPSRALDGWASLRGV